MTRPLRLEFPGALYHVTSRGNARAAIYADDADRERFLALLTQVVQRDHWLCHASCLMDNHYHLLLETPEGHVSHGMRQVNGLYTQYDNRRHGQAGHVFQPLHRAQSDPCWPGPDGPGVWLEQLPRHGGMLCRRSVALHGLDLGAIW
jgi:REP element-mobilizing transposase RayT